MVQRIRDVWYRGQGLKMFAKGVIMDWRIRETLVEVAEPEWSEAFRLKEE